MVKLAMIGAGGYAYELIKRIWKMPDKIELVAVTSNPIRKSAGRGQCLKRGVPVYSDVNELLDNIKGKADVVFVPTPIHTHFSLSKLCLEKGFEVWLEKPPVVRIQELDNLAECAKKYNKTVPVAFQSLYTSIMQKLKQRLVNGEFGKVKRVRNIAGWPRFDSYYNRNSWAGRVHLNGEWILDGTINNPLAHMLSNALYLATHKKGLMAKPKNIQAELYSGHIIESEDTSSLRIITDENVEVIFNASLCSKMEIDAITVVECEKATIEYVDFSSIVITFSDGKIEKIDDGREHRIQMLESLAFCYDNNEPYICTLETCRPFTLAVNGAFESCGGTVPIDSKYIKHLEHGDDVKTVIEDIDEALKNAHSQGKLFSEIDVEWSKSSKSFDLTNYKHFPVSSINK